MSEFTCVVCPWGCLLKAEGKNISGYSCSRGLEYAKKEQIDPRRSISGTVRVYDTVHNVLPVKTSAPIPKHLLLEAAALLVEATIHPPIETGDIVISDILGTGINFVATRSLRCHKQGGTNR